MANEAVIVELGPDGGRPVDFTCASGTAIAKGTILQLSGDRTASASSAGNDVFGGIAAAAKSTNDYAVNIAAYQTGVFDLRFDGGGTAIVKGQLVSISGANTIQIAVAKDILSGCVIGKALEAAAHGTAETIQVQIGNAI